MKKEHRQELDMVMAMLKASHPHLSEKQIRKAFLDMKKETEDIDKVRAEIRKRVQSLALAEIKRVVPSLTIEDIGVIVDNDGDATPFLNIRFGGENASFWGDFRIAETLEMKRCRKQKMPTPKSKLVAYTDGTARIEPTPKPKKK